MIQIIKENRKPTTGERFNKAFGTGLNILQEHQQKQKQESQYEQENEAAKRLGMDLTGIRDPKMRQEALSYALQGRNQEMLESQKLQGKQQIAQGKQDFLKNVLGGNQNQQMNPQEGQMKGFDPSNIPDSAIAEATAMDPALGRELRAAKDTALREKRAERDFQEKQKEKSPEVLREKQIISDLAKADVKYNQELQSAEKQHKLKSQSLDRLEKLNQKGVTGKPFEKILEKTGLIALTSEGRREFAADVKNLITDIRSILGSQFSQFEFQTILNAYPSPDFSKGANTAIIKNLQEFQDIRNKEFEIAKEIKKENAGKIPSDFQALVNERVQQYAQSKLPDIKKNTQEIMREEYGIKPGFVLMFDPSGEPLEVSPNDVEKYESLGASIP